MNTSAAFTTTPPLSPARQRRREQILQLANRRGWLVAPRAAHIVEACHSAWKAGTLPEVSLLPSPSSSEQIETDSDSDACSTHSLSSGSSHTSSSSAHIDLICDTLREMDMQGGKCQSNLSPKLKSGSSQVPLPPMRSKRDKSRERTQKEFETIKEKERRDLAAMKQSHMKSLSITSERNSRNRILEKTRAAAASEQNFVSSRTARDCPNGSLLTPITRNNRSSMTHDNQPHVTDKAPLSMVRSNQIAPKAGPMSPSPHRVDVQQRAHAHLRAYAATTYSDPQIPRGKVVSRRPTARQRVTENSDQGSEHDGLKHSREWLQPGPFFKTRDESARKLMQMFDRVMFNGSFTSGSVPKVTLEWNCRLMKTAGQTKMKKHSLTGERRAVVVLSTKVIDEPVRLYKTLAHELCHAAAWIIDNTPKPPHGEVFKAWGERFRNWDNNLKITRCHDYKIHYKYNYTCVKCGKVYGRHSKSIDTSKKVCGICKSALQLRVVP